MQRCHDFEKPKRIKKAPRELSPDHADELTILVKVLFRKGGGLGVPRMWACDSLWQLLPAHHCVGEFRKDLLAWLTALVSFALPRNKALSLIGI